MKGCQKFILAQKYLFWKLNTFSSCKSSKKKKSKCFMGATNVTHQLKFGRQVSINCTFIVDILNLDKTLR